MLAEAVAAINRTVILRLERNLRLLPAFCADYREHLALLAVVTGTATLVAAIAAASGRILEILLVVEFLLTNGENELLAAILARQRLVFRTIKHFFFRTHEKNPLTFRLANPRRQFLPTAEIRP